MGKGSLRYDWSHERAAAYSANSRAAHRGVVATEPFRRISSGTPSEVLSAPPRKSPATPRKDVGWPVFEAMLRGAKLPLPQYEVPFHPVRKWRFDMAWVQYFVAVEVDGGIYSTGGGHGSVQGILRDMEKGNAAQVLGWRFLRYTPDNLARAIDDLKSIIARDALVAA